MKQKNTKSTDYRVIPTHIEGKPNTGGRVITSGTVVRLDTSGKGTTGSKAGATGKNPSINDAVKGTIPFLPGCIRPVGPQKDGVKYPTGFVPSSPKGDSKAEELLNRLPHQFKNLWLMVKDAVGENVNFDVVLGIADKLRESGELSPKAFEIIKRAANAFGDIKLDVRVFSDIVEKTIDLIKQEEISKQQETTKPVPKPSTPPKEPKKDKTLTYLAYGVIGYIILKKIL